MNPGILHTKDPTGPRASSINSLRLQEQKSYHKLFFLPDNKENAKILQTHFLIKTGADANIINFKTWKSLKIYI